MFSCTLLETIIACVVFFRTIYLVCFSYFIAFQFLLIHFRINLLGLCYNRKLTEIIKLFLVLSNIVTIKFVISMKYFIKLNFDNL